MSSPVYDICVIGNSLIANLMAYCLKSNNTDKNIVLVKEKLTQNKKEIFIPSVLFPIFSLDAQLASEIYIKTYNTLSEMQITSGFEFSSYPLYILFRSEKETQKAEKLKIALENANIKVEYITNKTQLKTDIPIMDIEEIVSAIRINNALVCDSLFNLSLKYLKMVKNLGIKVIEEEKVKIDVLKKKIVGEQFHFKYDFLIDTSHKKTERKIIRGLTPIVEKFPKISIVDISQNAFFWVEKGGYINLIAESKMSEKNEIEVELRGIFNSLFSYVGKGVEFLDLDSLFTQFICELSSVLDYSELTNICRITMPVDLELSLGVFLANYIANKIKNGTLLGNGLTDLLSKN